MNIDLDGTEEVKLPQHTDIAIHNFFALGDEERNTVNSATSLICNGVDLRTKMKSLSFVAFVSSIDLVLALVKPGKLGEESRLKALKKAWIYTLKSYVLVLIVLFIAAVVETVTIIYAV